MLQVSCTVRLSPSLQGAPGTSGPHSTPRQSYQMVPVLIIPFESTTMVSHIVDVQKPLSAVMVRQMS